MRSLHLCLIGGLIALCALAPVGAVTVTTTGSGNWSNTTVNAPWPGGTVPSAGDDVVIDSGHSVTVNVATIVGNLTINSSGLLSIGAFNFTNNGIAEVYGTVVHTSGTGIKTFTGKVTLYSGGLWTQSVAEAMIFGGDVTLESGGTMTESGAATLSCAGSFQNDGTYNPSTGIHTFSGVGKMFSGTSGVAIPSVTITGSYTNTGTLTVSTALAGAGTLTQGDNAVLNLDGTTTAITTLNATSNVNVVNYTRATAQTIKQTTYNNLTLAGSGVKTIVTAGVIINGTLSMEGTATASLVPTYRPAATLQYNTATGRTAGPEWKTPFVATGGVVITNTGTITQDVAKVFSNAVPLAIRSGATLACGNYKLTLGGIFTNDGTFDAGTGTVEWNATNSQNIATGSYYNVILSGSGAKSIFANTTVGNNLSIAPTGSTATALVEAGINLVGINSLTLGGFSRTNGTWGSTSATSATYQNNTFFSPSTGYLTVTADARTTPLFTSWPTASTIITGQMVSASTLIGGSATNAAGMAVTGVFTFDSPTTIPPLGPYSASVTFTPSDPTSFLTVNNTVTVPVASLNVYYVVPTNPLSASPFNAWTNAATNIATAVDKALTDLIPGTIECLVIVTNGTYAITNQLSITHRITLRSANDRPDLTVIDAGDVLGRRVLSNTTAIISGFTLRRGRFAGNGGSVWMSGGMLTNCTVSDGNGGTGGGIYMTGGLITHCVISSNSAGLVSYVFGGGGVYMSGGVLENSLIVSNSSGWGGGGIYSAGGLVRNCLIRKNKHMFYSYGGGGVYLGGGSLLNCTVVENLAERLVGGVYVSSGKPVTNCIVWNNICNNRGSPNDMSTNTGAFSCSPDLVDGTNGNTTANPFFVDPANGNFRVSLASPCRNTGAHVPNMGNVDLDDAARLYSGDGVGIVDMGAYEVGASSSLQCDFSANPVAGPAPLQVVFSSAVAGPDTSNLYYGWDFDNNGSVDTQGVGLVSVTNTYAAGLYSVKLTVSNAVGAVTNMTRTGYVVSAPAIVYVATNSSPAIPYDTWGTAATNPVDALTMIQQSGGTMLLSNGTFTVGAEMILAKDITLRGVNGWSNTVVQRASGSFRLFSLMHSSAMLDGLTLANGAPGFDGGCVWMNGGTLTNCLVRGGTAINGGGVFMTGGLITHSVISNNASGGTYVNGGGGVYMSGGVLENSLILTNSSGNSGAGVNCAGGLVRNCLIQRNVAPAAGGNASAGGGAAVSGGGVLMNCTLVENRAWKTCGGVLGKPATNCIIWDNICDTSGATNNIGTNAASFSCSPDLSGGLSNTTANPLFVEQSNGNFRLSPSSPCVNAGTNAPNMGDLDLDDSPRLYTGDGISIVDMGCYELGSVSSFFCDFSSSPDPAVGLAPLSVTFTASVSGPNTNGLYYWWDFDNNGSDDAQGFDQRVVATNFAAGLYTVKLTVSNEVGTVTNMTRTGTVISAPPIVYVSTNGPSVIPYDTWGKAATNLNDAVAFQQAGGAIWVSNGVYTVGAEMILDKGITVRGVDGPSNTVVQRTSGSFRLFSLMDTNAILDGLTIANGSSVGNGGCVWMTGGTLTNCIVRGGAAVNGGGVFMGGGLITHCAISNNNGSGSYTYGGGGVYMTGGVLEKSLILTNISANSGAGVNCAGGLVRNCLILRNVAPSSGANASAGGGAAVSGGGVLLNCTIVENRSAKTCGGVVGQPATNCIIWYNTCDNPAATNNIGTNAAAFSCSPDLTGGLNNTTNNPQFVSTNPANYHLKATSPCRTTGRVLPWMADGTDLEGNQRVVRDTVDMGCYQSLYTLGTMFVIH